LSDVWLSSSTKNWSTIRWRGKKKRIKHSDKYLMFELSDKSSTDLIIVPHFQNNWSKIGRLFWNQQKERSVKRQGRYRNRNPRPGCVNSTISVMCSTAADIKRTFRSIMATPYGSRLTTHVTSIHY
jgi:hypothetical protein